MRIAYCLCVLTLLLHGTQSRGQAEKEREPLKVSLCDLYQHPEQYSGKMIEARGTVAGNDLWIDEFTQQPCPTWMGVIVVLPEHVKPRPSFNLIRDESFAQFKDALRKPMNVQATFEGRFDSVVSIEDEKRVRIGKGYGKNHQYDGRIVLHKVSDVVARYIPRK